MFKVRIVRHTFGLKADTISRNSTKVIILFADTVKISHILSLNGLTYNNTISFSTHTVSTTYKYMMRKTSGCGNTTNTCTLSTSLSCKNFERFKRYQYQWEK